MTTPEHKYETIEGDTPHERVQHEARTVKHAIDGSLVSMMTEIGDGVFVAWGECRRCSERVTNCTCSDGPSEPPFMQKWRDERFEKSFNTRPEPTIEVLASVIDFLTERGYTVEKPVDPASKPQDVASLAIDDLTDQERDDFTAALEETREPASPDLRTRFEAEGRTRWSEADATGRVTVTMPMPQVERTDDDGLAEDRRTIRKFNDDSDDVGF